MKEVTISVTQEDIEKGLRYQSFKCPIARAMQREFGCSVSAGSFGLIAFPGGDKDDWGSPLPASAFDFMLDFDMHIPVAPFSFSISVPDDVVPSAPIASPTASNGGDQTAATNSTPSPTAAATPGTAGHKGDL